jgi:hypothetical protein
MVSLIIVYFHGGMLHFFRPEAIMVAALPVYGYVSCR